MRLIRMIRLLALIRRSCTGGKATMNGKKRKRVIRLSVELTQEELAAIDDFRFATRSPSRAAAARELLKIGMASRQSARPGEER